MFIPPNTLGCWLRLRKYNHTPQAIVHVRPLKPTLLLAMQHATTHTHTPQEMFPQTHFAVGYDSQKMQPHTHSTRDGPMFIPSNTLLLATTRG